MQIKMLETALGADDGVNVQSYEAGHTYDLSETLTNAFIGDGVAEPADAPAAKPKAKRATKDAGAAPENKSQ